MAKNIDDSKLSYRRKVRFELPKLASFNSDNGSGYSTGNSNQSSPSSPVMITVSEHRPTTNPFHIATTKRNEKKVHGTANYVNGTLTTNDYSMLQPDKMQSNNGNDNDNNASVKSEAPTRFKTITTFRNQLTNDASAKNARKNCSNDQQYWDNAVNRRGILLHVSSENQSTNQIKFRNNKFHRYASILMKPSNCLRRTSAAAQVRLFHRSKVSSNTLELPTLAQQQLNKLQPKPKLKRNPFERFSYKLISIKKPAAAGMHAQVNVVDDNDNDNDNNNNSNDTAPVSSIDFDKRALSIVQQDCCALNNSQCELEHHCTSQHLSEILQNLDRWQCTTTATATHTMPTNDNHLRGAFNHSVEFCTLKKLDVKQ